ncbi:hypothetical protein BYI23_D005920 (plasmid) [Burkholderia sp. YI23]|nr:hypothetical protein BYI23_D005920 [Burkholderia sp. YI23]
MFNRSWKGFLRDDGLWDIEGEVIDEKGYDSADRERGTLPAGSPYHNMCARLTVDNELRIHAVATSMPATPVVARYYPKFYRKP